MPIAQAVGADVALDRPRVAGWQGWTPWIVVSAVVIVWTHLKIFAYGAQVIPWPGLHKEVLITLYADKPYAANWTFQPLATGTAILLSAVITAGLVGVGPGRFIEAIAITRRRSRLQVVAANQLGLDPVLIAATNSPGGVMGRMISPQNIATGVSVTNLHGQEGVVLARTFKHSVFLTVPLGLLVLVQQYIAPWMIP